MSVSRPAPLPGTVRAAAANPRAGLGLVGWLKAFSLRRTDALGRFIRGFVDVLSIPAPDTARTLQRIEFMERQLVLPVRVAWIALLLQPAYCSSWLNEAAQALDVPLFATHCFFWGYAGVNVLYGCYLFAIRWFRPTLAEWMVFVMSLVDGVFLGVLTLVTGGYNSPLYWLFLGLIARCAVSVPRATSQLMLNMTLSTCYILAGVIDSYVAKSLDPTEQRVLELYSTDTPAEPLLLRLVLLSLMTFGCYAVQVLLERQRQVAEEAREFAVREVQLRSAGRLAAEFAHQIKNPLAIINTAAFSLQRACREGKAGATEQIQMIQEEVERADRIITQVMGYAQLTEGHVERLDVVEELDHAVDRVFPAAAHYPVQVRREYRADFPPLLMQRRHASETFINVLQNAREALGEVGGTVVITAQRLEDQSIEVSIQDDGPGIPADKQVRIFEAYYTTKEKGSGLGLATVKNTVELYGGSVRIESELGKGARFVLLFPARTLTRVESSNT